MRTPSIPIVFQRREQDPERVVGIASDMEHAERLLLRLAVDYPDGSLYIDCSRTADEVKAEARA